MSAAPRSVAAPRLLKVAPAPVLQTTIPASPGPGTCYLMDDSNNQLDIINRTGTGQRNIGNNGVSSIEAIALSLDGNTVYAANDFGTVGQFGTLSTTTGAFSLIGNIGSGSGSLGNQSFIDVDGLAIDPNSGIMYGTVRTGGSDGGQDDLLIQIDLATGAHVNNAFGIGKDYVVINTSILGRNIHDIDDIAVDTSDGQMYGMANVGGGSQDRLVKINKETGAVTDVGQVTLAGVGTAVQDVEGFSFANDGVFFAVTGTNDAMYTINKANAEATKVADLTVGDDYEGVACLTDGLNTIDGIVFFDNNGNGAYNAGDGDVLQAGVEIDLYRDVNGDGMWDAGDELLDTATTDTNGFYEFETATDGKFIVRIDQTTLPANATGLSLPGSGDFYPVNFTGFGLNSTDNDFAFITNPSVGDTIYYDQNGNGIQDASDYGLAGVVVELDDGTCTSGVNCPTETTDANGNYLFNNVTGGGSTYTVRVLSGVPASLSQSGDPDQPGVPCTTSCDGQAGVTVNSTSILTMDFGYAPPPPIEKAVDKTLSGPNQTLTYTLTVSYPGSDPFDNATVTDAPPANTTYVGDSDTPEADIDPAGGSTNPITWNLGTNTSAVDGNVPGQAGSFGTITEDTTADTYIQEKSDKQDDNEGDADEISSKTEIGRRYRGPGQV